jgi:myosin-1
MYLKIYQSKISQLESAPPCARRAAQPSIRSTAAPRKKANPVRNTPRPTNPTTTNSQPISSSIGRSVPPPPPPPVNNSPSPPPPPPSTAPQYKAIYPFKSQEAGEIAFEKGDLLEIIEKDENGWWLARKDGIEGWVPSNYLEEYVPPVVRSTPPPPPPPARRAPPSVPTPSSIRAPPQQQQSSVPAWKQELEARKAGGVVPPSASTPVPAARRAPPAPGPKPMVPAKPSMGSKPVIPSRPGGSVPTPAPRAPPRAAGSNGTPSNAAASLADAVSLTF